MNLRWDHWPVAAGIAATLLVLLILYWFFQRVIRQRFGVTWQQLMPRMVGSNWISRVLWLGVLAMIVMTLLKPYEREKKNVSRAGLDLVVAIDFSASMRVADVEPDRLARAKQFVRALLEKRQNDRVAFVAFAGPAIFFPMTTDHHAAMKWFSQIRTVDFPGGSDLEFAFELASCLGQDVEGYDESCAKLAGLERSGTYVANEVPDRRGRAIFLITDGGDPNQLEGMQAKIKLARDRGQLVFIVGVGSEEGGRVPKLGPNDEVTGLRTDPNGTSFITSSLQVEFLRQLALAAGGGGQYLELQEMEAAMSRVDDALRDLQVGKLMEDLDYVDMPRYWWFLLPLVLALAVEIVVSRLAF